jgi:glycosyltransferase involved in cell wall biosynthesis
LVPEVFDNPRRLAFFREISDADLKQFRFIVFDMLPLTHPQYFWAGTGIYEYFKLLRRAEYCGFISEDTRQDYYRRTRRMPANGGVVLPLGCDALGPRPATPALNRPLSFSVIGTVEPRKNHRLVLEAFEPLLRSVPGLTLSFVGRMGWVSPEFNQKIQALASDPTSGFRFFSAPGDRELRESIEASRATLYLSAGEGYGLPPVESLWVGTPVIASNTSPSLKPFGSTGIHVVEPLDVENTRKAILAFVDDKYANQKALEAFGMRLQTWQRFAEEVLQWAEND